MKPDTGYPSSEPLTSRKWTLVAVAGAALVLIGGALHTHVLPDGRLDVRLTPIMIFGVVLIVIAIPMRSRAVARSKQVGADIPSPPRINILLKPIRTLGAWVVFLLCLSVVIDVSEALALAHRIDVMNQLRGGLIDLNAAATADTAVILPAGVGLIVFVVTGVLWCIWQHRAQTNAIQLAGGDLRFTPGWAVGWWFIPVGNLWKPFQTVRELWMASYGGERWRTVGTWPVIGWWWGLFLADKVTAWISRPDGVSSAQDVITGDAWLIVSLTLEIMAALLAIKIVRTIVRLQESPPQLAPGRGEQQGLPMPPPPHHRPDATAVT